MYIYTYACTYVRTYKQRCIQMCGTMNTFIAIYVHADYLKNQQKNKSMFYYLKAVLHIKLNYHKSMDTKCDWELTVY